MPQPQTKKYSRGRSLVLVVAVFVLAVGLWAILQRGALADLIINGWVNRNPSDSLEQGLVAHWTFDATDVIWTDTGNEIKDASGNNYHLNSTNLGSDESTVGVLGQALGFGKNTSSEASYGIPDFDTLSSGSISGWIRWNGLEGITPGSGTIFSAGACNNGQLQISLDKQNSEIDLYIAPPGGCTASIEASTPLTNPRDWHHFVFTDDSNGNKLYIDGVQRTLNYTSGNATVDFFFDDINSSQDYHIGNLNGEDFQGALDDIRVYNRALSADEVRRLYNQGSTMFVIDSRPGADTLTESLVGYWPMDEADIISSPSPATSTDRSGNGYDGTIYSVSTTTGKIGDGALTFSGTGDYVAAEQTGILDQATEASVCFWLNYTPGSVTSDGAVLSNWTAATDGFMAWVDDTATNSGRQNTLSFVFDGSYQIEGSEDLITPGQWDHYCTTFRSNQFLRLYKNGILNQERTDSVPDHINAINNYLYFGQADEFSGLPLNAQIDEVRLYARALSDREVANLYTLTEPNQPDTSLVTYYTFDGPDVFGTTTIDRGFGGNNGTLTNGPNPTRGKNGQALNFDGTNDSVNLATNVAFDNLDTKTISVWIKPTGLSEHRGIAGRSTYAFQICSNDVTDCSGTTGRLVYYHEFSGVNGKWILGADSVKAGQWSHVVVTYDRSSTTNDPVIYVNGVAQSVTEISTPTGTAVNESSNLYVGYDGYVYASGAIDDFRLYNRILSPTEVTKLYQTSGPELVMNASMNSRNTNGLVGLWSFDGPDIDWGSNQALDKSGNGNDGTMENMSTTSSPTQGVIGQALTFSGSTQYVSLGSIYNGVKTVSFWIKPNSTTQPFVDLNTTATIDISAGTVRGNNFSSPTIYVDGVESSTIYDNDNEWHLVTVTTATGINASAVNLGKISTSYLTGKLDDVRFYNKVLSSSEVQALYLMGH